MKKMRFIYLFGFGFGSVNGMEGGEAQSELSL